jgi:septal ring-binding cell division protein DamX
MTLLSFDSVSDVGGIDLGEASSEDVSTPATRARRARWTAQTRKKSVSRMNRKTKAKPAVKKLVAKNTEDKASAKKIASGKKTATVEPAAKKAGKRAGR